MSSPTKSTTCIENLPPEMINELFEYLHPKDLAACSMVNRRWHSIHAAFKLHRLVATDDPDSDPNIIKWHSSNRPIQEAKRCGLAMFGRLSRKPLLSNLEHLAITGSFEFDFNELNRFSRLVHLEIDTPLRRTVHLNLPKLRLVAFHRNNYDCALSIDCPELNTLLYQGECKDLLDVKHPETIRKLETDLLGPKLAPFKNVESLVTYQLEAIDKATLLSLPALRELRYDVDIEELVEIGFENRIGTLDDIKEAVSGFLDDARKLRGSDFRFTFCGFQVTNVKLDQIDFGLEVDEESGWMGREYICREYVYMKNYNLIEPGALQFVQRIDYTRLLSHVTGEFPRCFSQKFTGIQYVKVDDVVKNPDQLLWFLKSQMFLRSLNLNCSESLSQEFYDQLPAVARSLLGLELCDQYEETGLQLNFDFLGEFSCLSSLMIYPAMSLRSTTSLVRWLGGLKNASVYVRSGRDLVSIEKERDSTVWKVQKAFYRDGRDSPPTDPLLFETENPSEIANFFEEHRAASSKTGRASD